MLLPWPVVEGGEAGVCAVDGAVVELVAGGVLDAVVSVLGFRVSTKTSTKASTTAPAIQPHIALDDPAAAARRDS